MKRFVYLFIGACIILLSACKDTAEVRGAAGGYTYKTSGVVTINHGDTTMDVHLTPETGTMVLASNLNGGEAVLNFNHNGGDSYNMSVTIKHDSLFVDTLYRTIDVQVSTDTLALGTIVRHNESFTISVSGCGKRLSNGDISMNLNYQGKALNDDYTLVGKDIFCHCKRNAD